MHWEPILDPYTQLGDGTPQEQGLREDGASYLQRLKSELKQASASTGAKRTDAPATASASICPPERRQSPRIRCSGSVELRTGGVDSRIWGTLTDISLHGCYVEVSNTSPVGTKVHLVLKSFGVQLHTPGIVRASYPSLGMGISFSETEPEQKKLLQQLIDLLSGSRVVSTVGWRPTAPVQDDAEFADPKSFVEELRAFFKKSPLLSRDEFQQIAKRARRS